MAASTPDPRLPRAPERCEEEGCSLLGNAESRHSSLLQQARCYGPAAVILVLTTAILAFRHASQRTSAGEVEDNIKLFRLADVPKADRRVYQHHVLANGMQVLNIQDSNTTQMAMAVAVRAGSYDDPAELPGLAHFCEHMLFLGTEKYPGHSDFDGFLSKYGGSSNAYTSNEATVYFASASHAASEEALDRFADFFRAPLFKEENVKKEVQAIDSEHAKDVQDNDRRIIQLLYSQADPASVVPRFATGNIKTLYEDPERNGTSPVLGLKKYFKHRYCPNQMRLVTFGPEDLSKQLRMVEKAGFQNIPEGDEDCVTSDRRFAKPLPFPPSRMGRRLLVRGTMATSQLWLHFSLPDLTREYKSQPIAYLNYVITYGGEKSLRRVLSDSLGLISGLTFEVDPSTAGTSTFAVFDTTDFGFNHSEVIVDVFFGYLSSLRSAGVDMALYKSLQDMNKLEWDWQQPSEPAETVSNLAEVMTRLPRDKLLSGDTLITEPDPKLVTSLLDRLQPSNMNIAQVTPRSWGDRALKETGEAVRTLPHYGVEYVVQSLNEAMPGAAERWTGWLKGGSNSGALGKALRRRIQVADAANKSAGLEGVTLPPRIPEAIDNIPTHISLEHMHVHPPVQSTLLRGMKGGAESSEADDIFGPKPVKLDVESPTERNSSSPSLKASDVWFRSGWVGESPKVSLAVAMRPLEVPEAPEVTALDALRLRVYQIALMEAIGPELFDLTASGSAYDISVAPHALYINFDGYEEALMHLISKVLMAFNGFNQNLNATEPRRFDRIVRQVKKELNSFDSMPAGYAAEDTARMLRRGMHSRNESLAALSHGLSLEATARAAGELLLSKDMEVTALAMGNLGDLQATKALQSIISLLQRPSWVKPQPAPSKAKVLRVSPVVQPSTPVEVRALNPRPGDTNDVVSVTLLYGVSDVESRVVMGLLSGMLGTAAFQHLRTEKQLGYVVEAYTSHDSNVLYATCLVQGTKLNADDAEAAIEGLFTATFPDILHNLTQDGFKKQVDAFRQAILQPPLGKSQEAEHFWNHLMQGGCMHLLDEVLRFLDSPRCSKDLLVETWKRVAFGKEGSLRKKVSVKYFAKAHPGNTTRPSLEQARKAWREQGVAPAALELLSREWQAAKVFQRADSEARADVVKEGSYFPTNLHCGDSQSDGQAGQPQRLVMRQLQSEASRPGGVSAAGPSLLHAQRLWKGTGTFPGNA